MATVDSVTLLHGLEQNLPILQDGVPAITEDTGRFCFGTVNGNVKLPSQGDIEAVQTAVDNVITVSNQAQTTANNASSNSTQAINTASQATTTANNAVTLANQAISTANVANANSTTAGNTADEAKGIALATQNQTANIVAHNGDGTKDTELIDMRFDNINNIQYTSAGERIDALTAEVGSNNFNTLQTEINTTNANLATYEANKLFLDIRGVRYNG